MSDHEVFLYAINEEEMREGRQRLGEAKIRFFESDHGATFVRPIHDARLIVFVLPIDSPEVARQALDQLKLLRQLDLPVLTTCKMSLREFELLAQKGGASLGEAHIPAQLTSFNPTWDATIDLIKRNLKD